MRGVAIPLLAVILVYVAAGEDSNDWDVRARPVWSPCDTPYELQPFFRIKPELYKRHPPKAGPWEEALTAYSPGHWSSNATYLARFHRFVKKRIMGTFGMVPYMRDEEYRPVRAGTDWIFRHDFALPQRLIQQSVSTVGDRSRMRRVMHKLTSGKPIGIAVIGGSVSEGGGTHEDWKHEAYVGRVFDWLQSTFPGRPHVTRNGAIGGTTSVYYGQCVQDFVPEADVDLVIVEFTVNDKLLLDFEGNATENARQSFELLMRKLLSYKNRPAVLVVHYWSPGVNVKGFVDTYEGIYESVVQYYGAQSLSWRNTMYHSVMTNATGLSRDVLYCDHVHPTMLGHRYMGDMVIAYLQDAVADILINPLTAGDNSSAMAPLPTPMMPGTDPEDSECWRNDALKAVVRAAPAWSWVDEGKHKGRHKYGYVTTTPNSTLDFVFSSECSSNSTSNVTVGVGHLKSYAKMGLAEITCVSGCHCALALLNGSWESPSSQENWQNMFVSQAPRCHLRVVSMRAPNGDAKVKLTSLLKSCIDSSFTARQQYGNWHQYLHWSELDLDQHAHAATADADSAGSESTPATAGDDSAGPESTRATADADSAGPTSTAVTAATTETDPHSASPTPGDTGSETSAATFDVGEAGGVSDPGVVDADGATDRDVAEAGGASTLTGMGEAVGAALGRTPAHAGAGAGGPGGVTRELAETEGQDRHARGPRHHPRRVKARENEKRSHNSLKIG